MDLARGGNGSNLVYSEIPMFESILVKRRENTSFIMTLKHFGGMFIYKVQYF